MPAFLHTCYRIGDIDRSVEFYEALGFDERRRMPIGDDETLAGLAQSGIEPEKPPYRPGGRTTGSRICFVRDPDGYRIEIVERSAA